MINEKGVSQGLPELTGARALAATMVFWYHYMPAGGFLSPVVREMHSGVTIFFVLSGFLIHFRHSDLDSSGRTPLIRYCFHRFARIYPMYFLVVVAMAAWSWFVNPIKYYPAKMLVLILMQITFIRGFSDTYKFFGVGQGWTLTVEVTFYVLFPTLLRLVRRFGFFLTLLLTYIAGALLYFVGSLVHFAGFFRPFEFVLIYTFFGRAGDFFAGMMLSNYMLRNNLLNKRAQNALSPKIKRRVPIFTMLGGTGILACLWTLALLDSINPVAGAFGPWGCVVYILVLPPFVCSLFYGLIMERSWASWFFGTRLLVIMGASSYCFYLIHVGGPNGLINRWVTEIGLIPGYFAVVCISVVLWKLIEEPIRRLILRHPFFRHDSRIAGH